MTQDTRVAMVTSLDDRLIAPLKRTLDQVEREFKELAGTLGAVKQESQQLAQTLAKVRLPTQAGTEAEQLARKTEQARRKAQELQDTWGKVGNVIKAATAGAAAYAAAKAVAAPQLQQNRTYTRQLADAANIAFPFGQRDQGAAAMDTAVVAAVKKGGGTRESALKGLNDLFAANIDQKDALGLLPVMQTYATAGNADMSNIAQLVIYGLKSLKLSPADIPLMLDKTLQSTKGGSMEFDNLAKWMPIVGAAGSSAGMRGMHGYEQMLAGLQVSKLTAGTKDEAGTNFRDLLSLINGHALMTAAKRMGIDATGSIASVISKGGTSLDGIVALADHVANSDPRFKEIDRKIKAGGVMVDRGGQPQYTPEQVELMQQQAVLFQGSALGKLFHNQQSMQSLVALRQNPQYFATLMRETAAAKGQVGPQDFETIAKTSDFKVQQADNSKLFARTPALEWINERLARLSQGTSDLYEKYPVLAKAVETATFAISTLGAAAGSAAVLWHLLGRGAPAGVPGSGMPTGAPPALPTGGGGRLVALLGKAGLVGGAASLLAGAFGTTDEELQDLMTADRMRYGRNGMNDPRVTGQVDFAAQDAELKAQMAEHVRELRAAQLRPIVLHLDGVEITRLVTQQQGADARRR